MIFVTKTSDHIGHAVNKTGDIVKSIKALCEKTQSAFKLFFAIKDKVYQVESFCLFRLK
jgi:hypothetical protein